MAGKPVKDARERPLARHPRVFIADEKEGLYARAIGNRSDTVLRTICAGMTISPAAASGVGSFRADLGLLGVRIGGGIGLAVHARERRGSRRPAFLLVLVLLRFLLFLVASHLTLRHGGLLRFRWSIRLCRTQRSPGALLVPDA